MGASPPQVGDPTPDFTLPGTGGRSYTLSEFRGHPVVLVFYPGDGTPVCTRQLTSYRDRFDGFAGLGAEVLALSPQGVDSHERFSAGHALPFPLLADTDKAVGAAYGVVSRIGFYRRAVFVVDAGGVVRYAYRTRTSATYPAAADLLAAVEEARHPAPQG